MNAASAPESTLSVLAGAVGDFLFSGLGPWLMAGGLLLAGFGLWLLWLTRHTPDGERRAIFAIAIPALGCGGCLFAYPFIALAGAALTGAGVVALCQQSASC